MDSSQSESRGENTYRVHALFSKNFNAHFYETIKYSKCNCVIDGDICHDLWRLSKKHCRVLSSEANFAFMVENFFRSFIQADIKPYVILKSHIQDINVRTKDEYLKQVYERHRQPKATTRRNIGRMRSRILFGEVMKALGIPFCVEESPRNQLIRLASFAKSHDAVVIAGKNFFFFANVPRGYLRTMCLDLSNLQFGLIDVAGPTYFRKKFMGSFRAKEQDESKVVALFATLTKLQNDEGMENFIKIYVQQNHPSVDTVNFPNGSSETEALIKLLRFVADRTFYKARRCIFGKICAASRKKFDAVFKEEHSSFEGLRVASYEQNAKLPVSGENFKIEEKNLLNCTSETVAEASTEHESVRNDEVSSGGGSRDCEQREFDQTDDSRQPIWLPYWFEEIIAPETPFGSHSAKFRELFFVMNEGVFIPVQYHQDPNEYPACLASFRARRVLYGILLQYNHKQLQAQGNPDAIDALAVEEYIEIPDEVIRIVSKPVWSISDSSNSNILITLPTLFEMENLDIASRKQIFAIAMVGTSSWLKELDPEESHFEYNLLLLRSWAKRSPNLQKIHVTALLLSILSVELQYDKKTCIFPWPISLRKYVRLPPQSKIICYEHLHSFAQLQSVTDTASQLNVVLNSPYGLRVDSVREFYSESLYHDLLCFISEIQWDGRMAYVAELFDHQWRDIFFYFVDALYGDEDELERAPLYLTSTKAGFPPQEILSEEVYPFMFAYMSVETVPTREATSP